MWPKRATIRHLYWLLPLFTQFVGVMLGPYPDWLAETRAEIKRAVQVNLAPRELTALTEKFGILLNKAGLHFPFRAQTQSLPTARKDPFSACRQFFAGGRSPILPPEPLQRPLCYEAFAILHSGQTKTPVFVAQKLNKRSVADADEKRTNRFFADARLPRAERAELEDYRRSGYSRGHMAPAGDMPNPAAMAQSFSLANMVPQSQRHNGGAWSKVEQDTRKFVQRSQGNVYIITGPVYSRTSKSIGANRVRVPDYIFKLVYDEAKQKAWAHWHPNRDDARRSHPISYQELVRRTGIQFLPGTGL